MNAAAAQGTNISVTTESDSEKKGIVMFQTMWITRRLPKIARAFFMAWGIISVVTTGKAKLKPIPRRSVSFKEISSMGIIGFHYYRSQWNGMSALTYTDIVELHTNDETVHIDLLLENFILLFSSPKPGWNGFMQNNTHWRVPGKGGKYFHARRQPWRFSLHISYPTFYIGSRKTVQCDSRLLVCLLTERLRPSS